jgi:hypothetical protein
MDRLAEVFHPFADSVNNRLRTDLEVKLKEGEYCTVSPAKVTNRRLGAHTPGPLSISSVLQQLSSTAPRWSFISPRH